MKKFVTHIMLIVFLVFLTISLQAQIIISEIMQNPAAVGDTEGEWIELYNSSGADVDIDGWTIRDDGTDNHLINNGGPLIISAGGFLVLGNNGDTGTNGGVPIDYVITGTFFIGNSGDELILEDDSTPTIVEIDRVEYDGGPNWPDPTGASMVFSGIASDDNNDGSLWITATFKRTKLDKY